MTIGTTTCLSRFTAVASEFVALEDKTEIATPAWPELFN